MGLNETEIITAFPAKPAMELRFNFTNYALVISVASYLGKVICLTEVNFHRKDIRLSVSKNITKTDCCSSKEECAFKCLIDAACGSVRIYPLTGGFLSERLAFEPTSEVERRVYEDLNGK